MKLNPGWVFITDFEKRGSPTRLYYTRLRHEGKTVLECRDCKRTIAVYDWRLKVV